LAGDIVSRFREALSKEGRVPAMDKVICAGLAGVPFTVTGVGVDSDREETSMEPDKLAGCSILLVAAKILRLLDCVFIVRQIGRFDGRKKLSLRRASRHFQSD
jgi:hypothetical protein